MEISKQIKRRILFRTMFLAFVCFGVGAFGGYYYASMEAASKVLTELSK